ncbi:MAG TPA: prenyltransferase [Thermoplasmatales archaeon]|nr:prenyltransferase [Thermoplasmatales archaeon]
MNEKNYFMKKLIAIWQLMRLEHGFMIAIAIFIGAVIAGKEMPSFYKTFFAFLTALFLEGATFSLNDYFDLEVDRKNKRIDRPLVRGDLKKRDALLIYSIFLPSGIIASSMVNETCFIIAMINAILATLYDVKIKEVKIVGNFYIAFVMAIPFIFGATAVSLKIPFIVYLISLIAFLSGAGREIMKDVMDFVGDEARKTKSFPLYFGKSGANYFASLFYLSSVTISFVPFLFYIDREYYHDFIYLAIVLIADFLLIYTSAIIVKKTDVETLSKFRKITLIAIFIGLVAFLTGAFV